MVIRFISYFFFQEIKGEDKIMVEACCSQPPEEAADSNEVILSVVVHSDDRIG